MRYVLPLMANPHQDAQLVQGNGGFRFAPPTLQLTLKKYKKFAGAAAPDPAFFTLQPVSFTFQSAPLRYGLLEWPLLSRATPSALRCTSLKCKHFRKGQRSKVCKGQDLERRKPTRLLTPDGLPWPRAAERQPQPWPRQPPRSKRLRPLGVDTQALPSTGAPV